MRSLNLPFLFYLKSFVVSKAFNGINSFSVYHNSLLVQPRVLLKSALALNKFAAKKNFMKIFKGRVKETYINPSRPVYFRKLY